MTVPIDQEDARALCREAQGQADAFGRSARAEPTRRRTPRAGPVQMALAVSVVAAATGLLCGVPDADRGIEPGSVAAPRPGPPPPRRAASPPNGASTRPPQIAAHSAASIGVEGGIVRVDIDAMPARDAALRLASVTQTTLDGAQVLGADPARITMHWQGRSVAAAWRELLPGDASFATRCDARACRVWIAGGAAPAPARSSLQTGTSATAEPLPAPPSALAVDSMQPDPPGLFPSGG
jgi:hypothetical protein